MLLDLTNSAAYGGLFGDPQIADQLSGDAEIRAMITVERALAQVQAELGVIPAEAAAVIDDGLDGLIVDSAALRDGTASAGVAVPALLAQVRRSLPQDAAAWLHWGATSQDIVDTATVLQLKGCLDVLESRLGVLLDRLQADSARHSDLVMAARTRGQVATPITFGLKIARWADPLIDAELALTNLRQQSLRVQFGGAAGANTAVAPHGPAISRGLAEALGLQDAPPWHVNRTPVLQVSSWLGSVASAMAKLGADLVLLSRTEIGEVRAGAGGGSSTMPQKANPVAAEALVTLGRLAGLLHGGLSMTGSPVEERDGAAWALEWILLPQLVVASGAAMLHAQQLADTLAPDANAMQRTLDANPGAMAEAASFALAASIPRPVAQGIVRDALASDAGLMSTLASGHPKIDWPSVLDPSSVIATCRVESERVFAKRG